MKKNNIRIILKNIWKHYCQNKTKISVLTALNGEFFQGKTTIVSGSSGSGKSTLLHLIAGLECPTTGSVWFGTTNLTLLSEPERTQWRKQYLGMMFQFPYLIRELSVLENVMLPGLIADRESADVENDAVLLLRQVGLQDKILSHPCVLSGGQQQRVALARALFNKPAFLLADEPTAHLDRSRATEIRNLLLQCQDEHAIGLIIATHDEQRFYHDAQYVSLNNGIMTLPNSHQERAQI